MRKEVTHKTIFDPVVHTDCIHDGLTRRADQCGEIVLMPLGRDVAVEVPGSNLLVASSAEKLATLRFSMGGMLSG